MSQEHPNRLTAKGLRLGAGTAWIALLMAGIAWSATNQPPPEQFQEIEKAVASHFEKLPGYRSGNLITRAEIGPLLGRSDLFGWLGSGRQEILDQTLSESDPLVRELRSPKGRKFMGQVSQYPEAYDHLDRLSGGGKTGQRMLQGIIADPRGREWIMVMTTTKAGRHMAKQLATEMPKSKLDKPTGRLYTAELLTAELKRRYDEATR